MARILIEDESFDKHFVARIDGTFTQVQNQPMPVVEPLEYNLDHYVGYTFRGKPVLDLNGVIAQIDSGEAQKVTANNTITYTFLKEGQDLISVYNNPNYGFTSGYGLSAFRPDQIAFARKAIGLWDDLIAPSFREVNGRGADIQFANSWDPAQAYAYYPSEQGGYKYLGDVFIADARSYFDGDGNLIFEGNYSNADLSLGGYGQTTIVHELGHSIGLSHPGNYNYDPNLPLNYANYAEYAQDSEQYSIMSYWSGSETGARIVNWGTFFFNNEQTPLLHDILVAQVKYGADPTTRAGNTVYGFNSTAGKDVYDFNLNPFPYLSIYDAGGIDTLDMSGFRASMVINLNGGEFSSAGQGQITTAFTAQALQPLNDAFEFTYGIPDYYAPVSQTTINAVMNSYMTANANSIAADWGHAGVRATEYENISIAYGTVIENAIGGAFRDLIVANAASNVLTGGGGADVFVFQHGGTDTITDFAVGSDKLDLSRLGVTAAEVAFSAGSLTATHGATTLTLAFSNGALLSSADVVFA